MERSVCYGTSADSEKSQRRIMHQHLLKYFHTLLHWSTSQVKHKHSISKAKVKQDIFHMQKLHAIVRRISRNCSRSRRAWRYKAQRIKNKLSCQKTHKTQIKITQFADFPSLQKKKKNPVCQHTTISSMQIWQYIKEEVIKVHKAHALHVLLTWSCSHFFWVSSCIFARQYIFLSKFLLSIKLYFCLIHFNTLHVNKV